MDAFSMLPFLCEGFRNSLHFLCVLPKAGNSSLECYYLCINSNKAYIIFTTGHDLSEFLWILAAFPYWKRIFVCTFATAVLYLLILLYSGSFLPRDYHIPGGAALLLWDFPPHLCQWRIISFFDECYILWFTFHPSKPKTLFSIYFFSSS